MSALSKLLGPAAAAALLALAALVLAAPDAAACPVCYGEGESAVLDGARLSVIFLGALTYGLLGGAAVVFVALRRKVHAHLAQGATLPPEGA